MSTDIGDEVVLCIPRSLSTCGATHDPWTCSECATWGVDDPRQEQLWKLDLQALWVALFVESIGTRIVLTDDELRRYIEAALSTTYAIKHATIRCFPRTLFCADDHYRSFIQAAARNGVFIHAFYDTRNVEYVPTPHVELFREYISHIVIVSDSVKYVNA